MTACPPRVRMRMRNPWVLARLRLLGWNVRFTEGPPRGGLRAEPERGYAREAEPGECRGRSARSQSGRQLWGKPRWPLSGKAAGATLPPSPSSAWRGGLPRQGLITLPAALEGRRGGAASSPGRREFRGSDDLHSCGRTCGQGAWAA
jgi:hypothetical protein